MPSIERNTAKQVRNLSYDDCLGHFSSHTRLFCSYSTYPSDAKASDWSGFNVCSKTCGTIGTKTRFRRGGL